MTTVLVAGEGIPLLARLRAVAPDAFIICLTTGHGSAFGEQRELSDRVIAMAGREVSEWVALSRSLHGSRGIDAVCAFGEMGQRECAAIAADLGLPWHSISTIRHVYDKVAMRERLREAGLSSLHTIPIRDAAELTALSSRSAGPLIVKPRTGSGSAGICLVRSAGDADEAFSCATGAGRYGGRAVIAETFAVGDEFSVEAFSHCGTHSVAAITTKIVARESKAELGHIVPAATSPPLTAQIEEFVPQCLEALGITFGPTHTEVIASATGVEVIETHTRCGGGHITDLVREATGVDLIDLTVRQALGSLTAEQPVTPSRDGRADYAGIFFLTPDWPGTVVGSANSVPPTGDGHLIELDLSGLEGLDGGHVPASNHVRGPYCIVLGSSPAEAAQAAARIAAEVRVTVRVPDRGELRETQLCLAATTFLSDGLPAFL
jgi:biotin carboxylase